MLDEQSLKGRFRTSIWEETRMDERRRPEANDMEVRSFPPASAAPSSSDLRQLALDAHRDYYAAGVYDIARLTWTIDEFFPTPKNLNVLEIGCGDGAMLQLLATRGAKAQGIDASSSGIARCRQNGLAAQCLDVSTDGIPFPAESFELVISLETFEHLMNPFYALQEVRRVLRPAGRFICSVPNPLTGHPYLYPGLFDYPNFRQFLVQGGFTISRVRPWEWAPRDSILPRALRHVPVLRGRIVAGGLRKLIEKSYLLFHAFPAFCYWLWTFDCRKSGPPPTQFHTVSLSTMPGSAQHFSHS